MAACILAQFGSEDRGLVRVLGCRHPFLIVEGSMRTLLMRVDPALVLHLIEWSAIFCVIGGLGLAAALG